MSPTSAHDIAAVAARLSANLTHKSKRNEPVTLSPADAADLAAVLSFLASGWQDLAVLE